MTNNQISTSNFEYQLSNTSGFQAYLKDLGLPYENILAPDHERAIVYCKIKVQTSAKNLYRVLHYFCA